MAQYELSLRDYWRIIRKRYWIIIFIFSVIIVSIFIYNQVQPHIYQTSATVRYTEQRLLATLLTELIQKPAGNVMLSQVELIKSWAVAELSAKSLNWIKPDTPVEESNRIISSIQSFVDAEVKLNTDLIIIKVQHTEPQKTSEIANAIAKAYKDYNLIEKSKQASNLRETVQNRLSQINAELLQSETELQRFKEQNQDVTGSAIPAYNRFEELKKEQELLMRKYTGKHPDVIRIDKEIEALQKELGKYPAKEITLSQLMRNITINSTLYSDLKQQFERARIAEGEKTSDVAIVNLALTPTSSIKPDKRTNLGIGFLLGLIISVAAAFIIEHLDTSIGTIEEIEELTKLPVLGVIPYLLDVTPVTAKKDLLTSATDTLLDIFNPLFKSRGRDFSVKRTEGSPSDSGGLHSKLIWNYSPTSPLVEAYRTLRTNLIRVAETKTAIEKSTDENMSQNLQGSLMAFSKENKEKKIITITSTGQKEGKTITSSNLAMTMALRGEMVILVDMDMRNPTIHRIFGLERENGLSDILIGIKKLDECVRNITDMLVGGMNWDVIVRTPGIDNLHILTGGTMVPNPSELLSRGVENLLNNLRSRYNYIICDCPPILSVADVLELGPKTDLAVLVYRAGKTAKGALLRAKQQMISSQINLKGLILNYVTPEIEVSPTYYYQYYRYYPSKESKAPSSGNTSNPHYS